ncbi:YeaH/YhbH family protein [Sansalvadorimonas sp. 2012CJ34-2]|uniref:UPF0229 protein M3P05_18620 n=1 Tax=Parendozoicomonas callyspongiae TaxID=2942213 RepID=A0ABT0PKM1_9GAMM|nr:YeaH/YhbH family protein [Sansalvadorimonas sp. 2012CJ34-2]MCL6271937.1 YeaH/YhbH family protein [Sansalvadorimonas sp. 2012CJ34-2]
MSIIIDRRLNAGKKSTVNRQRFLRRYKNVIKKSVQETIDHRSIKDTDRGSDVSISRKDLTEPFFSHGQGGQVEHIHPGNKEFQSGDRFNRPPPSGGQGTGDGQACDSGEGMDEFVFQINREEFLDYVFEDLELPNLVRKELKDSTEFKYRRAGFTNAGSPDRINVIRSLKQAHARRIALGGKDRREIRALRRQLRELEVSPEPAEKEKVEELRQQIKDLNQKLRRLPFIDEFDLCFNNMVKVPQPSCKAVMFCVMDVSGSMTQSIKDIAKRFFMLLYLFLQRNYESLEVVFIRHHTIAQECTEEEFFYSRQSGGTLVSTALKLAGEIIAERYPVQKWNIYVAQASDGDNWDGDNSKCEKHIVKQILPNSQYFAYVEIADQPQNLWYTYKGLEGSYPDRFAMQKITSQHDIYPVFRRLFEKREGQNA